MLRVIQKQWQLIRYTITGAYWVSFTKILLVPRPWQWVGGETLSPHWEPNFAATLPSILAHASGYWILTWLTIWMLPLVTVDRLRFWSVALLSHAVICEGLQYYIPDRWCSWTDLYSNLLGIGLGLAIALGTAVRWPVLLRRVFAPLEVARRG